MASYIAEISKLTKEEYNDKINGFFKRDATADKEISEATETLKELRTRVEETESRIVEAYAKKYAKTLFPCSDNIVFDYNGHYYNYPLCKEVTLTDEQEKESNVIRIFTKNGTVFVPEGYALNIGAMVVKQYKYNIVADCSKINLRPIDEYLYKFIGPSEVVPMYKPKADRSDKRTIEGLSAREFLELLYDCRIDYNIDLGHANDRYLKNDCFEIVLKTAPHDIMYELMEEDHNTGPCPVWNMMGVSKADYDYFVSEGCARALYFLKDAIMAKNVFGKTPKEWVGLIKYCKNVAEDMEFNNVTIDKVYNLRGYAKDPTVAYALSKNYYNHRWPESSIELPLTLAIAFVGTPAFYNNYSFGKFVKYVVEETQNQGYTSLSGFLKTLQDYIEMCEKNNSIPVLFTSTLEMVHNIASRNNNVTVTEEQEKLFKERYDGFTSVSADGYKIMAPKESHDIKREGDALCHCVASYIKKIIDNKTKVFFLRKIGDEETPLVTLEVLDGKITQAEGRSRRKPCETENKAIAKIAEKLGLVVAY